MNHEEKQRLLSRKIRVKKRNLAPYAMCRGSGEAKYDYAAIIAARAREKKAVAKHSLCQNFNNVVKHSINTLSTTKLGDDDGLIEHTEHVYLQYFVLDK